MITAGSLLDELRTQYEAVHQPTEDRHEVESFEAIANGDLDDIPEQAFLNVGGIEQVHAKAKALQESAA